MKIEHLLFKIIKELEKGGYTKPELELIKEFSKRLYSSTEKVLKKDRFEVEERP